MHIIISIVKIVVILGFLVLIHEAWHFLVARLCKIKVNEFPTKASYKVKNGDEITIEEEKPK